MDKALVQELGRLRLKDNRLPAGRAVGIRETSGDGRQCDASDEPIVPKQKAVLAMVSLEWMSVRFHVDCYAVWDAERLALADKYGDSRGGQCLERPTRVHPSREAREAIRSANLPSRSQDRTVGGPGSGAACAVCGETVTRRMTELVIEFN